MERDYSEVFEIKKKNHGTKIFVIMLIVLLLIASIVYLVYSIINSSSKKFDIYRESHNLYAVTMAQSDNLEELQSLYSQAVAIGGSGYVWQGEEYNYLIALIYPSEDMAKSVVASNQVDNFGLDIISFKTPEIAYNLDEFLVSDIESIAQIVNYAYDMSNILYELTIAVHIGNISSIACASTINNHKGEMLAYLTKMENILELYNNSNIFMLHQKLVKLINILDKMVNELLTNIDMTNVMKYNYCDYVYELCS